MTIEQVLMRSMKTSGGLTRGRGLTDSVLSRWILAICPDVQLLQQVLKILAVSLLNNRQNNTSNCVNQGKRVTFAIPTSLLDGLKTMNHFVPHDLN